MPDVDVEKKGLILCWRGAGGDVEPVPCWCETFGHPNRTVTGEIMYANSHFLTSEEAWEQIEKSVTARLSLARDKLLQARRQLADAERGMMEAGLADAEIRARRDG